MHLTLEKKIDLVQHLLNELIYHFQDAELITLEEVWMLQASIMCFNGEPYLSTEERWGKSTEYPTEHG